ncbi:hypothetical protein BGX24_011130 [Mortierella sp. AD032]|nr:hypothetical protein BGX24_011130 [Mortierella sp. AD032]
MMPWRPLGMLTFGLTIIFLFVRLHGDGYDFPVQVVKCDNTLDFPKPSRTFLEISGVYHDDFWEWPEEQDQDGSIPIPVPPSSAAAASSHASSSSSGGSVNHSQQQQQQQQRQGQGLKFGVGWNSQWHLGKKKSPAALAHSGRREEDGAQDTDRQFQNGHGGAEEDAFVDSDQWLWMTNVWFEDGDSGSAWELMYTHRFPGIITHTSLSRRILPEASTGADEESQDEQPQQPPVKRGRESIRLAIMYKVVQEEHVSYHSRVYHFGTFQHHAELRDCELLTTATCHRHAPFLNFEYVLPGSSPIKDFSLEYDMIYYSRLYDTSEFRSVKLPRLSEGATTPERPFTLTSGTPGPVMGNVVVKKGPDSVNDNTLLTIAVTFSTSVFQASKTSQFNTDRVSWLKFRLLLEDPQVLVGQVSVYQNRWAYQASITTETTEAMTGYKRWQSGFEWSYTFKLPYQETDYNDETTIYEGVPIQKPYLREPFRSNGAPKSRHWILSSVDVGALDVINSELGTVNDANDILALKTTLNSVVILRRGAVSSPRGYEYLPWRLSMILSDINYSSPEVNTRTREVIGMKIVTIPAPSAPGPGPANTESNAQAELQDERANPENEKEDSHYQDSSTAGPEDNPVASPEFHNILFLVHGDGKILGYDLDQATESSSAMLFLKEKYLAVIGMLVVVATFVINEARYAIVHP